MGIDGIKKTDGRLVWPETKQGRSASRGDASQLDPWLQSQQGETSNQPAQSAQSLGVWRKNRRHDHNDQILNAGEAATLLKDTAPKIAQTPKKQLTGLQDVIDRYWINPGYY